MQTSNTRSLAAWAAVAFALLSAPLVRIAAAEERPAPVGECAAGALRFPDDGVVTEGLLGGAARVYVSPRISVGPEIAYIQGQNHSHLMLTGNMTFDLAHPENGRVRAVTPFVVVGGGWYRTRELFPNREVYTSSEGAFTAGGGVRALAGTHVIVGAETRIGWELHLRISGLVGVRLGR
jgi:hypothetical protein